MKSKKIIIVLAALLIVVAGGGYYYWYVSSGGPEDTGGPVEDIPEPMPDPGPLTTGEHDWPCWGGANHDNHSDVTGIRTDWSGGLRKLWEVHYLCQGDKSSTWSAPVVVGNRLVVPGRDADSDWVFCIDPDTGKLRWRQSYEADTPALHGPGSRATPTIDGDRVYTFGRGGDLVCWQLRDGKMLWRKNVEDDGGAMPRWGHASSPLVHGNNVIVQGGGSATAIAYDKMTGKVAWKWKAPGDGKAGYAAPQPMQVDGATQLLIFHATGLAGLTPDGGRQIWNVGWETRYDVHATTPMVAGGTVFITSGYGEGCAAVDVSADGASRTWKNKSIKAHHSDPAIIDGYVYGYSGQSDQNDGDFVCLELADGSEQWKTGEIGHGTMVRVDGHLMCLDNKGDLFLVKPDPGGFKKVAEFPDAMPDVGKYAWTRPVIANGKLFLRYRQSLICYDLVNE